MSDKDNTIKAPSIGEVIVEDYGIGQLADNHPTLIAPQGSTIAKRANEVMKDFHESVPQDALYNKFELDVIEHLELSSHPKTKEHIDKTGCNLLVQLYTPGRSDKQILCVRTSIESIEDDIALTIYTADRISHENIVEVVAGTLEDDPDSFDKLIGYEQLPNDTSNSKSSKPFIGLAAAGAATMGAAVGVLGIGLGAVAGIFGMVDDHDEEEEIGKGKSSKEIFLDMLKEYRHHPTPQLMAKIKKIVETVPPQLIVEYLAWSSKRDQERFFEITPEDLAKQSTMDLEIKHEKSIDKNNKNDGYYRLYFNKKGLKEPWLVHFNRKESCVLYFLYLIDRKKDNKEIDATNFNKYKEKFKIAYDKIYGKGAFASSDKVVLEVFKKESSKSKYQTFLKDSIRYMREDVGGACEKVGEPSSPFIINDIEEKIAALPKKITIPQELMDIL